MCPRYTDPTEVELLVGDPSLAKVTFRELVSQMAQHDLELAGRE